MRRTGLSLVLKISFLALSIWLTIAYAESNVNIPLVTNLRLDAKEQEATQKSILLYVASQGCAYCARLEKDVIEPMIKSGNYNKKLILRKIVWESSNPIVDFSGKKRVPADFLSTYAIEVTPTLLFLKGDGSEIEKRIVGYQGGDFYWYYLDSAIDRSNQVLRNQLGGL